MIPTHPRRTVSVLLAGGLAVAALVGCTPAPEPEPTKTELFASDEEAFAAAEETYRAYTDALNQVDTRDPDTFEPVYQYSSGSFEASDKENLSWMHAENLTLGGETRVIEFVGTHISRDRSDIQARVCIDVSAMTLVNPAGESQVNPTRPDTYALDVTFKADDARLLIDSAQTPEDQSCGG